MSAWSIRRRQNLPEIEIYDERNIQILDKRWWRYIRMTLSDDVSHKAFHGPRQIYVLTKGNSDMRMVVHVSIH